MPLSEAQKKAQYAYQNKRKQQDKINTIYLSDQESAMAEKAFSLYKTKKAAVLAGLEKLIKTDKVN